MKTNSTHQVPSPDALVGIFSILVEDSEDEKRLRSVERRALLEDKDGKAGKEIQLQR